MTLLLWMPIILRSCKKNFGAALQKKSKIIGYSFVHFNLYYPSCLEYKSLMIKMFIINTLLLYSKLSYLSDPNLLVKYSKSPVGALDRNKHNHVIENGRCNLCNITIASIRTKHCSVCNKVYSLSAQQS